jgi:Protein of unknown function (DUF1236)
MRKSLFSIVTASALVAGASISSAQTTTTTTTEWTPDQRTSITQYSTTQHYKSFSDPQFKPNVGTELPGTVTVYPLPDTVKVDRPDRYSYGIVNDQPVVIDRSSRKVIHSWN